MRFIPAFIIFLSITCALHSRAQVIDYAIDTSFSTEQFYNRGIVKDLLPLDDGTIFVSGNFGSPGTVANGSSIISNTGQILYNTPFQQMGFGKVQNYKDKILGYGFSAISWFDMTGSDYSFSFEFFKSAYSGPLSYRAHDLIITPDENILVAGRFFTDSTLMGTAESYLGLRQLCLIDSTGAPVQGFPMLRCAQPVDAEIYTLDTLSNGQYIIAGRFEEVDGHPTNNIARLNADFSVDTEFFSLFTATPGGTVFVEFIDSNDGIWINGAGSGLSDYPDIHPSIVRLLPDGNLDPDFVVPELIYLSIATGLPYPTYANLVEDADSTFIISGNFHSVNGIPRKGIAKIDRFGSLIPGVFDVWGADEAVWGSFEEYPIVGDLLQVGDGKWLAGGRFSSFGGEPYSCLVRLKPDGFVGLEEKKGRVKLKIWPNPSHSSIRISLPIENGKISQVEIVDIQGRQVLNRTMITTNQAIDISNLKAGIYLVKASDGSIFYTQKLMVQ